MSATSLPTRLREIGEKVENKERLSFEDGMTLFETDDLLAVGTLANQARERVSGDLTYYNVNRHLNYTNPIAPSVASIAESAIRKHMNGPLRNAWKLHAELMARALVSSTSWGDYILGFSSITTHLC